MTAPLIPHSMHLWRVVFDVREEIPPPLPYFGGRPDQRSTFAWRRGIEWHVCTLDDAPGEPQRVLLEHWGKAHGMREVIVTEQQRVGYSCLVEPDVIAPQADWRPAGWCAECGRSMPYHKHAARAVFAVLSGIVAANVVFFLL